MAPSPVSDTHPAWRDVLTAAILIPTLIAAIAVVDLVALWLFWVLAEWAWAGLG